LLRPIGALVGAVSQPFAVISVVPLERKLYETVQDCTVDLCRHNWEYMVQNGIDGKSVGAGYLIELMAVNYNISFEAGIINAGELALWEIHLRSWSLQTTLNRPIVSVESDTHAIRHFDVVDNAQWKDYDLLFAHEHRGQQIKCAPNATGVIDVFDRPSLISHSSRARTPKTSNWDKNDL